MKNKIVSIYLEEIFDKLATQDDIESDLVHTEYGSIEKRIDNNITYFDFRNNTLPYEGIVCMDGESCEVIEKTEDYVVLQEINERIPFKLSREEFKIATFG